LIAIPFCNFLALAVFCQGIEHKQTGKETCMDTLTTKLAALAGTLFMSTLVMGGVAYCFALQPNTYMTAVALAKAVATQQGLG
jgi:cytochrome bd-type quinol oxidase subunit 2